MIHQFTCAVMPTRHAPTYPAEALRSRCQSCFKRAEKLLLCTGCRAVRYCDREHQTGDWAKHKAFCNQVRRARASVTKEEGLIRDAIEDDWTPANAFETSVGRFWGFRNTRKYMTARFALADLIGNVGSQDGAVEALDHLTDMLRLCHKDNQGLRDHVPSLMLRLDRDQECYDFIKWWATKGADAGESPGAPKAPYTELQGADVLEPPSFIGSFAFSLSHAASLLLLKLKLLIDIRSIKVARKVAAAGGLPTEVHLMWEPNLVRSPLSLKLFRGKSDAQLQKLHAKLISQIMVIGNCMDDANSEFISSLLDVEKALSDNSDRYSQGSPQEAYITVKQVYLSFYETAGVLPLLKDASECAKRDRFTGYLWSHIEAAAERAKTA